MKIPFVSRGSIEPKQRHFIRASRGGSAFLLAGGVFWLIGGISALLLSPTSVAYVYLVGGLSVPLFALLFARLQEVQLRELRTSDYFSLVVMASAVTPICLPVLFAIAQHDPRLVAPSLTLIDSAHFPLLMWVHLDYTYFIAAYAKFLVGFGFLFWWTDHALTAVGFLSALVSVVAAVAVHRASKNPQAAYQEEAR